VDDFTRRDALKAAVATGAAASGCTDSSRKTARHSMNDRAAETVPLVKSVGPLGFPWKTPDPFLFCVHHDDAYPRSNGRMGPAASLEGRDLGQDFEGKDGWRMYHGQRVPGFPQHPHRGFETVTLVRRGLIDHSDSLGAAARFGEGDVQWLTAGRGILHSEMFPLLRSDADNPVELFQIWLNLPKADKWVEPHFSMLWGPSIPRRVLKDADGRTTELTVVAGRYPEMTPPAPPPKSWASRPDGDVAIWTLKLAPKARFTLPPAAAGSNRTLYFFRGASMRVGGLDVPAKRLVELAAEREAPLENGPEEAELLLLQGRPIREPVVQHGPFVMSSREEILQTFAEYQRTGFGGWPWPSDEPVHPQDEKRFARHADGRLERPA
jgi:redox-sensitive bicupin YhaK (pirin superfamily)